MTPSHWTVPHVLSTTRRTTIYMFKNQELRRRILLWLVDLSFHTRLRCGINSLHLTSHANHSMSMGRVPRLHFRDKQDPTLRVLQRGRLVCGGAQEDPGRQGMMELGMEIVWTSI